MVSPHPRTIGLLATLCLLTAAVRVGAQETGGFHLREWGGSLDLSAMYAQDEQKTSLFDLDYEETSFREDLLFSVLGDYYHERFIDFDLSGRIGLEQIETDGTGLPGGHSDRLNLGYNGRLSFFKQNPYTARLFATRNQDRIRQTLTPSFETMSNTTGIGLGARQWWMPMNLTAMHIESEVDANDLFGGDRETLEDTVTLDGKRHGDQYTLEAEFKYTKREETYLARVAPLKYEVYSGSLLYSQTFGEKKRNRWLNRASVRSQDGDFGSSYFNASSSVFMHLSPTVRSSSSLSYYANTSDSWGVTQGTVTGNTTLSHRLYDSLVSEVQLRGARADSDDSWRTEYGGGLVFNYQKKVPFGSISGHYGRTVDLREEESRSAFAIIQDEDHQVTLGLPFFDLVQFGVDVNSIVLTDSTGLTIYTVAGGDYQVSVVGPRIRITVPLTSSIFLGVPVGTPVDLKVDYRYAILPKRRFSAEQETYGCGVSLLDYASLTASWSRLDQDLLSGSDSGTLERLRSFRTDLQLNLVVADLSLAYLDHDSNFSAYERVTASLSTRVAFGRASALSASANSWETRYKREDYREKGRSATANFGITLGPSLGWNVVGSYTDIDTVAQNSVVYYVGNSLRWRYHDTAIALLVDYTNSDYNSNFNSESLSATLTISRRF